LSQLSTAQDLRSMDCLARLRVPRQGVMVGPLLPVEQLVLMPARVLALVGVVDKGHRAGSSRGVMAPNLVCCASIPQRVPHDVVALPSASSSLPSTPPLPFLFPSFYAPVHILNHFLCANPGVCCLLPEAADAAGVTTRVQFRLPDGSRAIRRFLLTDPVSALFRYIAARLQLGHALAGDAGQVAGTALLLRAACAGTGSEGPR
jgi:hypothetical protein